MSLGYWFILGIMASLAASQEDLAPCSAGLIDARFSERDKCVVECTDSSPIEKFCIPDQVNLHCERLELNLRYCKTKVNDSIPTGLFHSGDSIPTGLFRSGNRLRSLHIYAPSENFLRLSPQRNCFGCCVRNMTNNDTFQNLQKLEELILEGFDFITTVESNVFHPLRNLQKLTLIHFGAQYLSYRQLGNILEGLSNSSLARVTMDRIHPVNNREKVLNLFDLFRASAVTITHLVFIYNDFNAVEGTLSKVLPHLKYIEFNMYFLTFAAANFGLDSLVFLQNIEEVHYSFIGWRRSDGDTTTPDSSECYLCAFDDQMFTYYLQLNSKSNCYYEKLIRLSSSLKRLIVQKMYFFLPDPNNNPDICMEETNQLEYVDFYKCPMGRTVRQFRGLKQLRYFNLQDTGLRIISSAVFHDMPKLEVLLLGKNHLRPSIAMDTRGDIFRYQNKTLKTLDLSACNIITLPPSMVSSLSALQFLNLSENGIEQLDIDLDRCANLSVLNLSGNFVRTLSRRMTDQLEFIQNAVPRRQALQVDLSRNPLTCFCNNTEFVSWLQTEKNITLNNFDEYQCRHANGSIINIAKLNVSELENKCRLRDDLVNTSCPCSGLDIAGLRQISLSLSDIYCSYEGRLLNYKELVSNTNKTLRNYWWCRENPFYQSPKFIVPVAFGSLLLTGLVIALVVIYKKRYTPSDIANMIQCMDMRPYVMYVVRALSRHPANQAENCEYDLFVYFPDEDASWAHEVILSKIEHLKVISPHNFQVGAAMIDTILASIDKCRAIVFVLSPVFKEDEWCRETCLRAYTSRPSAVIPVIREGTDLVSFEDDMLFSNLLKTNNPIYLSMENSDVKTWNDFVIRIQTAK